MLNATLTGNILTPPVVPGEEPYNPVDVLASWNENDPAVFHMSFLPHGHTDSVDWVFARDLMGECLATVGEWVGEGDVALRVTDAGVLSIRVDSPEGVAVVEMKSLTVASLYAESCRMVEPGSLDELGVYDAKFDAAISALLDGTL